MTILASGKEILHRVQTRLLLMMVVISLLFWGGLYLMNQAQWQKQSLIFHEQSRLFQDSFDQILLLNGKTLENMVRDYSYWDDLVEFVHRPDPQWAELNLLEPIRSFKLDLLWVYTTAGAPVYATANEPGNTSAAPLPLPASIIPRLFPEKNRFCHFFLHHRGHLVEIRGATIHPTNDSARLTPPQGFLLVGTYWDTGHIQEIETVSHGKLLILGPREFPPAGWRNDPRAGIAVFSRPLADWQGRPLAILHGKTVFPLLPVIVQAAAREQRQILIFLIVMLAMVMLFTAMWVHRPLIIIGRSLRAGNGGGLEKLRRQPGEFGQLAELIARFFEQQEELKQEISERRKAQEALAAAETKYRGIFENAVEGILQITPEGRYLNANPELARIFGYSSAAEFLAEVPDLFHHRFAEADKAQQILRHLQKTGSLRNMEIQGFRKDGATLWVNLTARAASDDHGLVSHFEGSIQDISEQKLLESQLMQSQKLEVVGRLAGGIAHDFNNMLTAILGHIELLLHTPEQSGNKRIRKIQEAAERAARRTSQLLLLTRKQVLCPEFLYPNDIIRNLNAILQAHLGEDIRVRLQLADPLPTIRIDPTLLEQVLLNLAVNAREAMPSGGEMLITTEAVDFDSSYSAIHPEVSAGRYVVITVSDTGIGMERAVLERIFEPFFTTKERNTGLGLSMVYGIVKQAGGFVSVFSEKAHGTAIKVHLPAQEEDGMAAVPEGQLPRGRETILVVEDEEEIRELLREMLQELGYRVTVTASAEEALAHLEHQPPPDLLLTDVVLPGIRGIELAQRLKTRHPGLRVLCISGYPADRLTFEALQQDGSGFLAKPFSPAMLAHRLRRLLGESPL